jgi:hypothetical protein
MNLDQPERRWHTKSYQARHARAKALVKDDLLRRSLLVIALTVLAWFFLTFEVHGAVRRPAADVPAAPDMASDAKDARRLVEPVKR